MPDIFLMATVPIWRRIALFTTNDIFTYYFPFALVKKITKSQLEMSSYERYSLVRVSHESPKFTNKYSHIFNVNGYSTIDNIAQIYDGVRCTLRQDIDFKCFNHFICPKKQRKTNFS